jgi:3-oxoacyl-[acyl-carrier-protein] synthase II
MNRVVITGLGWITPMGHSIEAVWKRLLAGDTGIAPTTLFDASTFPTSIGAEVKDFRLADHVDPIGPHSGAGRNTQFALAALQQAWTAAGLKKEKLDLDRVGIYLGSGEGSLDFNAFTTTCLSAWDASAEGGGGGGAIDSVRWGELAMERMNVVRELEQEPNMPLSHLALLSLCRQHPGHRRSHGDPPPRRCGCHDRRRGAFDDPSLRRHRL